MHREWHKASSERTERAARRVPGLVELADAQWGVVGLDQLVALGVPASTVRNWVRVGRLVPLHRNVYAVGHRHLRREGHWLAAVLACGGEAVLSHRSAAALWGLRASSARRLEVTVASRAGRARSGLRVHAGRLLADEVTEKSAIPCTTVSRTLLDLAAVLDQRGLERACEQAERQSDLDLFGITTLLARHRGRRGVRRLRQVLAEWDADLVRTRSELEVRFLRLIARGGIERPIVNGTIALPGGSAPEVDFHWPALKLVIETDGDAFHRSPLAQRADRERDAALCAAGWVVVRFTYQDVTEFPERTLARVRELCAAQTPRVAQSVL